MQLRALLDWLHTLPSEDAAWIMEMAIRRLGGIDKNDPVEFGLTGHGVGIEKAMEWCKGIGLDDGLCELCYEKGINFTDTEMDEYVFQLADNVAWMIAKECGKVVV